MSEEEYSLDSQGTTSYSATPVDWDRGYTLLELPKVAGYYKIGGSPFCKFAISPKPCWFHRTMMRICLGWVWEDEL